MQCWMHQPSKHLVAVRSTVGGLPLEASRAEAHVAPFVLHVMSEATGRHAFWRSSMTEAGCLHGARRVMSKRSLKMAGCNELEQRWHRTNLQIHITASLERSANGGVWIGGDRLPLA
jgi:hypothetical protein